MNQFHILTNRHTNCVAVSTMFVILLALPLFSGCSTKSSSKKTGKGNPSSGENTATPKFTRKSTKQPKITNIPKPDEAIKKLIKGLAENRPVAFWNALPASYRSDMNAYIREFAANMDPELWTDVFGLLKRVEKILKSKKKFFLTGIDSGLIENMDRELLEDLWDGYAGLIEIVLHSEFSDLNKLKHADLGKILEEKGGNTMNLLAAVSSILGNDSLYYYQENLASLEVQLVRSNDQSATLRFVDKTSRTQPFEQTYLLVEEKWVPIQWAQNWQRGIELLRFRFRSQLTAANLALAKKSMKEFHTKIDPILTQLENANTDKDFQKVLKESGILSLFLATLQTTRQKTNGTASTQTKNAAKKDHAKKRSYKIVILDSMTAKQTEEFADTFFQLFADIDISPPEQRSDTTTYTIDTKAHFSRILEKLSFVEIVKSDETSGIIEIRLQK